MKQKIKFLASFVALLVAMVCMSIVVFADEPTAAPAQVTGLKQTDASSSSIDLSYDTQLIDCEYQVELSEDGKTWVDKGTSYDGDAWIGSLTTGKTYYARVKAYTEYWDSNVSEYVKVYGIPSSVIKVVTEPDTVKNLKQTAATTNSMTFSWDAVTGATGYYVYQEIDNSGTPKLVATVATNKATIKNLKNSNDYEFHVYSYKKGDTYTAVSYSYDGLYSYDLKLLPGKINPNKVTNSGFYSSLKKVYFDYAKAPYTDGYEIRVYAYNKNKVVSKVVTTSAYTDLKNIKPNMFYKFKIRGYSIIDGQKKFGAWSNFKYISHQPDVISANQVGSKKQAKIKWDTVKGATNYTVYMSTKQKSGYKKVATTKKTSVVVKKLGKTNLKKNKTYYVYVVANRKVGKTTYTSDATYCWNFKLRR